MLFLINIGNTNTQTGILTADGKIHSIAYSRTESFTAEKVPANSDIAVSSVVPAKLTELQRLNPFIVSPKTACNVLDFSKMDSATLGADRVANAAALTRSGSLPAICIDCGTAITFECVNAERQFLGGAILPGRLLQRKALNSFTAQLPLTELASTPPVHPGANTREAISCGIDAGIIGALKELIAKFKQSMKSDSIRVVISGGDADFFVGHITNTEKAPEDFTLRGIAAIWDKSKRI